MKVLWLFFFSFFMETCSFLYKKNIPEACAVEKIFFEIYFFIFWTFLFLRKCWKIFLSFSIFFFLNIFSVIERLFSVGVRLVYRDQGEDIALFTCLSPANWAIYVDCLNYSERERDKKVKNIFQQNYRYTIFIHGITIT